MRFAIAPLVVFALAAIGCGRLGYDGGATGTEPDAGIGDGLAASLIESGWNHVCVISSGTVYCWGLNSDGQLGDGSTNKSAMPVAVVGLPLGVATAVAAGRDHSCAIVDGDAYCWGSNIGGQLGTGDSTDSVMPRRVVDLPAGRVTDINAGQHFTCAIADGAAFCWGAGGTGQLGVGNGQSSDRPLPVLGLSAGVTRVFAGGDHGCGIMAGQGYCWGHNDSGALGNGSTVSASDSPVQVSGFTAGTEISIAGFHACGVDGGAAYCWGTGSGGELGDGASQDSSVPVQVLGMNAGVTAIDAGGGPDGDTSCAVMAGEVSCWGYNQNGQVGDGMTKERATPFVLPSLTGIASVTGGLHHFCAMADSGRIACWGAGSEGQLGNGDIVDSPVPVTVALPE